MPEQPFRRGHSRGWQQVENARAQVPTATPLARCGCSQLEDRPCGGAMNGPDGLCGPCRIVTPQALERTDNAYAHVGGVRQRNVFETEPLPHVTTLESAMRMP